jgi:hypothetical protein
MFLPAGKNRPRVLTLIFASLYGAGKGFRKQYPHRPGLASALGLRAGTKEEFVVSQTALAT